MLAVTFLLLCHRHRLYFTDMPIPSVDLEGHIAIIGRLLDRLPGSPFFYDTAWFTGWPAFHFYGFASHLGTALLAWCVRPLTPEPARLAVHLVLIFGCALLPATMYWASRPLWAAAARALGADTASDGLAALVAAALTVWFLSLRGFEPHGLGAAAVMQMGLFGQLAAWHLMLLHAGAMLRLLQTGSRRQEALVALSVCSLILAHPLTAAYSLSLAGMSGLWFRGRRWALAWSHLVGVGLAAFWLAPLVALSPEYTMLDIAPPRTAELARLLTQPWNDLASAVQGWFDGRPAWPDPMPPFLLALCVGLLIHLIGERRTLFAAFAAFVILTTLLFSGSWLARSVPVGLHYYRLAAYAVPFALLLLASVPVNLLRAAESTPSRVLRALTSAACLSGIAFALTHPHPALTLVQASDPWTFLRAQEGVLKYFAEREPKGRVLFEYLGDLRISDLPTPHYLSSRLYARTGFESVNGLFIQSSLAYLFPRLSAEALGADMYGGPFLTFPSSELPEPLAIEQLRALGVTHVVLATPTLMRRIRPFCVAPTVSIGPYRIVEIAARPLPAATYPSKPVVGYLDLRGNLPFKYVDIYFASRQRMGSAFDIVELRVGQPIPPEVGIVVVNGSASAVSAALERMAERGRASGLATRDPRVVRLEYEPGRVLAPAEEGGAFPGDFEVRWYRAAARYLAGALPPAALAGAGVLPMPAAPLPRFRWGEDRQRFTLTEAVPGRLVRVNYSYFPFWQAADAYLYRGTAERMMVLPRGTAVRAAYARGGAPVRAGYVLSLAAAVAFVVRLARRR